LQIGNPQEAESMVLLHQKLQRHSLAVNAIAFSPDGSRVVGGGQDRLITVWSVASSGLIALMPGHEQAVTCVAYSPHGNFILSGGQDGTLRLWDPETRHAIGVLRDTGGRVNAVAFCPARPTFVCASEGGWSLRNANNGQILLQSPGSTSAVAFSPDGALLAVGSENGRLALFSGIDGRPLGALPAHADDVLKLAFSPDGALLATGGTDGFLKVWQVQNGALVWENQPSILPSTGVSWSPDGRLLASSSRDHLLLWTREGQLAKRYTQHSDAITDLAFAPHSPAPYKYIVGTASRDKSINLCRVTGKAHS
jgi:WD40 repeat protein